MKRRRKFELFLADLWRLLRAAPTDGIDRGLAIAMWTISDFNEQLTHDPAKAGQLLEFARALRSSNAPGRQVAEERLMEQLVCLASLYCDSLCEAKASQLAGVQAAAAAPPGLQATFQAARDLHDFALACFLFKRPRDSFGGRRRMFAFQILSHISRLVDLPEVLQLARQALRKPQSIESRQASEFLVDYFAHRDMPFDDDLIEEHLSLVERTNSRTIAYGALNALVESGAISEFQALDRMDAWKDKHKRGC